MKNHIKTITEIVPALIFFILFTKYDLMTATLGLLISSSISLFINYFVCRQVSKMLLLSYIVLFIFSGITLLTGDTSFIKIKPTILYTCFAVAILYDLLNKKNWLKKFYENACNVEMKSSSFYSYQASAFFMCIALFNEIVWRFFSEAFWVKFKIFGITGMTLIFFISQVIQIHRKYGNNDIA